MPVDVLGLLRERRVEGLERLGDPFATLGRHHGGQGELDAVRLVALPERVQCRQDGLSADLQARLFHARLP